MKIRYIFNPEHDLCLANGSPHYLPPASALKFRADCHRQVEQWLEGIMGEAPLEAPMPAVPVPTVPVLTVPVPTVHPAAADKSTSSRNTDMIVPWGWNSVLVKQLRQEGVPEHLLPNEEYLNLIREYSRREHAVKCAEYLNRCNINQNAPLSVVAESSCGACNSDMAKSGCGQCDPSVAESSSGQCYPLPIVAKSLREVEAALERWGRIVLKSPLSGSGKGIRWVSEALSHSDIGWCLHNLEHYGSIIAEERQNVIQDFAMLFSCNLPFKSGIEFFGYSLFFTSNGAYKGSVVENDSFIEEYLCSQGANLAELHRIRAQLQEHLTKELAGWYKGFLGVDMFLFSPADKEHRRAMLNPVVEINLRLTMGHLFRHLAR